MESQAASIARQLGREAEAVCRYYLSNGRRQGRYWIVGDVENNRGRSLYVRLEGPASGPGAAGKWTDAATGEHGDMLDLIAANQRFASVGQALDEARRFLGVPRPAPRLPTTPGGSAEAARRLFAAGRPVAGTLADAYLGSRGILCIGTPVSPAVLLPARRQAGREQARDLARTPRRRQRPRGSPPRPPPHLARPKRRAQGAGRRTPQGDGRAARSRRAVWCAHRSARRRRRPRDDALTPPGIAQAAGCRRALGEPSRRTDPAGGSRPPLHRRRRR